MGIAFARQVARKLSADAGAQPPVDLRELMAWRGLELKLEDNWPSDLCARYYPHERRICVNNSHLGVRQRFSIAHELGHFALRHEDIDVDHGIAAIFGSEEETFEVEGDLEREANAFATELLMPKSWVEERAGNLTAKELAAVIQNGCHVSGAAAWYRVMELKLAEFALSRRRRR